MFPPKDSTAPWNPAFSPHARGCSVCCTILSIAIAVFPACAGMFRLRIRLRRLRMRFPRMRGDVVIVFKGVLEKIAFSPHARGCFAAFVFECGGRRVFPACAGMFRSIRTHANRQSGFPRMRGDVPAEVEQVTVDATFSPHARGCSAYGLACP